MEQILEILRDLHENVDFENRTDLFDSEIIDSFDVVSIIAEIEDVFGVVITADLIKPENFNSAKAIWQLVEGLMK